MARMADRATGFDSNWALQPVAQSGMQYCVWAYAAPPKTHSALADGVADGGGRRGGLAAMIGGWRLRSACNAAQCSEQHIGTKRDHPREALGRAHVDFERVQVAVIHSDHLNS